MGRIGAPRRTLRRLPDRVRLPDVAARPRVGISLGRQARYIQQAAYLAWRAAAGAQPDPVPVARRAGDRCAGAGSSLLGLAVGPALRQRPPKPAMRGVPSSRSWSISGRAARSARFWGQIRPGTGVRTVTVLRLRPGQNVFRRLATVQTDARGYWTRRLPVQRRAKYRFSWEEAGRHRGATRRPGGCRASSTSPPTRRGAGTLRGRERRSRTSTRRATRSPTPREAERMGRWRALGARSKADHVVDAVRPRRPAAAHARRDRLRRRGAAGRARRARAGATCSTASSSRRPPPRSRASAASRGASRCSTALDVPAEDGAYDLAILSHVLEHVPEPMSLLREAARVAPAVLLEVPLEDNRSARREEKREEAARIGHIQFFDRAAVHALVRVRRAAVAAELTDPLPYAHHAFFAETRGERATAAVKTTVRRARGAPCRGWPRRRSPSTTPAWRAAMPDLRLALAVAFSRRSRRPPTRPPTPLAASRGSPAGSRTSATSTPPIRPCGRWGSGARGRRAAAWCGSSCPGAM